MCYTTSSLVTLAPGGGGRGHPSGSSDTLVGAPGPCMPSAGTHSLPRVWQPGSCPLPGSTPGMPQRIGWKWEERINSQGGGIGSNRLLLPRGPRAPILGRASKAPGCLGTFPNKYARASSLSGKHGLPLPPPYHCHSSQLCSVGTLWDQRMAWEPGHLGPNPIFESQSIRQTSVYSGPASSSIYWDHGNAHLARGPDGRDRVTLGWCALPVPGDMQAGADGCRGG